MLPFSMGLNVLKCKLCHHALKLNFAFVSCFDIQGKGLYVS